MKRRQFLRELAAAGTMSGLAAWPPGFGGKAGRSAPNLLLVFPDQLRRQALGFMGQEPVLTPNLDAFARESVVFTQAVSNAPLCSPFRGMLMTGNYPCRNGVLTNCNSDSAPYGNELRRTDRCWSDVLKGQGYSLGYIGKWHLDAPHRPYVPTSNNEGGVAWNEWCPPERRHGFDFWYAYGTYDQHLHPKYWADDTPRDRPITVDEWGPIHETKLAIRYLSNEGGRFRRADRPFALVISMNPPHMPYDQVPARYLDLYAGRPLAELCVRKNIPPATDKWGQYYRNNIRGYYAMISGIDEQFGLLMKALRRLDLERDTIVVFASDHGNCLGIHGEISKNNAYEESLGIPLLIRWPGRLTARREDLLISVPDWYPTLLGLMGFAGACPPVQGANHAGLLLTGRGERPKGQLYLCIPPGQAAWGERGVHTERYTLAIRKAPGERPRQVLFDNQDDPWQLQDIAADSPALAKELGADLLTPLLKKTGDPWLGS
jgi:uncharacterized sulfatase